MIIALTGVISGLARGSNQTAIAHKVYESTRTLFPEEGRNTLHGELVAMGLLVQLLYNGELEQAVIFRKQMKIHGMPVTLAEVGIEGCEKVLDLYYEKIVASSAMNGTTDEEKHKLREALQCLIDE